jgi:hypothetical protein
MDIEEAAVRLQRHSYSGLSLADRLAVTGADASAARGRVVRDVERHSIEGVLFFATNDGLGAAGQRTSDGGRLIVVGLGDPAVLRKKVEEGEIDRLFYWSRSRLTLAGLELGRSVVNGRRFDPREPISLNIEGYEALQNADGNTWAAKDIGVLNP